MRLLRWLVLLPVLLALFALSGVEASAAVTRTGDDITVPAGETIEGDLYIFGRSVDIDGAVTGDVIGTAENVVIRGTIGGSLNLAARSIQLNGAVTRTARITGQELILRGSIGGDLIAAVNTMTATSQSAIGGDLLLASGEVSLSGPIAGDVSGSVGELSLGGSVTGDVSVSADQVTVTNRGRLAGDLRYTSSREVDIRGQGDVAGTIERTGRLRAVGGPDLLTTAASQIVRLLIGLLAGLVLIALFPGAAIRTADAIRTELPLAAMSGVIGIIIWLVLAVVLSVLIVGIPIALVGTMLLLVVAWLSQVFVGLAVGRVILPGQWRPSSRGYNILALALGMILIGIVRAIPVPYVSAVVAIFSAILAIGAVIMALKPDSERAW